MGTYALTYENDQEIIEDFVSTGNERAATAFVRKYQKFVYSIAFRYLQSHDDAEDASQEVFVKALRNLNKFRGDSSLKTWLYRITINICSNMTRKIKINSLFSRSSGDELKNIPANVLSPDKSLESSEFEGRFLQAVAKLPKKQRETFSLRYFNELSYEEISEMLGTSIGGLKANYFQAVHKLADYLKKYV